jgi:hypothetical protein
MRDQSRLLVRVAAADSLACYCCWAIALVQPRVAEPDRDVLYVAIGLVGLYADPWANAIVHRVPAPPRKRRLSMRSQVSGRHSEHL